MFFLRNPLSKFGLLCPANLEDKMARSSGMWENGGRCSEIMILSHCVDLVIFLAQTEL